MNFVIAVIAIIFISICGYGLIKLLLKENIPFSLFGIIPLSFGAGLGILAILSHIIMLLRMHISFVTLYAPLAILFSYALTKIKLKQSFRMESFINTIKGISWIEWLFIFAIIFGTVSIFIMSVAFPLHFWDSRAIWGTKAKMLFYSGTVFSSDFMDVNRIHAHFRYPLLFPISQAFIYFAMGHADDWAVMILIGLFFPLMVSFLYDLARVYLQDREKALAAAALVAVLPVFFMSDGPAHSGYADTPLAMLYCLSFGVTLLWKQNKDFGFLLLSSFLTAILFFTKNEGANLMALNVFLVLVPDRMIFTKKNIMDSIKSLLIYLLLIILIILIRLLLIRGLPSGGSVADISAVRVENIIKNINAIPVVMNFTMRAFIGIQKNMMGQMFLWGGLWFIFMISAISSLLLRFWNCVYLSLVVLLYIFIITIIYLILPWDIVGGDLTGNFFRLYQAINPVVALQIVSTLKALEDIKRSA